MKTIIAILISACFMSNYECSAQEVKQKKQALQKKAGSERERSLGGQRTESDFKDDKGEVPPDTANVDDSGQRGTAKQTSSSSQVITPNEDQPRPAEPRKSNAPAVIQITPSESGSPAIPAPNDGYAKDGTNTIQRSKPNMAGAEEPGNLNLSKKDNSERNIKTKDIRRQEEQPQQVITKEEQQRNKEVVKKQQQGQQKTLSPKEERKEKREKRRRDRKSDDGSGK